MNDEFVTEELPDWYRPKANGAEEAKVADPLRWPGGDSADAPPPKPPAAQVHIEITPAPLRRFVDSADDDGMAPGGPGWSVRGGTEGGVQAVSAAASFSPPVMPWDAPRRPPSPTRRYVLLGVAVFALIALAALVLVERSEVPISQPAAVGPMTRVDAPTIEPTLQTLEQDERSAGATNVVTAVYGVAGRPQLLLMVVQSPGLGGGDGQALGDFNRTFASGLQTTGWTLDTAKVTSTKVDSTTFRCNALTAGSDAPGSLSTCEWTDSGVAGVVVDLTGLSIPDTLSEAVQARAAAER